MEPVIPVSAVLITRDAQLHLEAVLASLSMCAEIVILDSGSSDQTHEIALRHGACWYEHDFDGYGVQKNRAIDLASHDWIVSVDADEVFDRDAVAAIADLRWHEADPAASWRVLRRPFVGRREIRYGHWVRDRPVRVFHRARHRFVESSIHEAIEPSGPVHLLPGSLLHYTYRDLAAVVRPEYHRLKAQAYRNAGRRAGGGMLAARAAWALFYSYVVRRGFLDGGAGVVVALAGALNAVTGLAIASDRALPNDPTPQEPRAAANRTL